MAVCFTLSLARILGVTRGTYWPLWRFNIMYALMQGNGTDEASRQLIA